MAFKLLSVYYATIFLILSEFITVSFGGQFFRVNKGNLHVSDEEAFLSGDVFHCSGQTTCTKVLRRAKLKGEDYHSSNTGLEINKVYGSFYVHSIPFILIFLLNRLWC